MPKRHLKVAISVPADVMHSVEKLRKQHKISRSECFALAVRKWSELLESEQLVRQYIEGYKSQPECYVETKAMELAQLQCLPEESW